MRNEWHIPGDGGLYSVIWIQILYSHYRNRPKKSIRPVVMVRGHDSSLSVCLYGMSVCDVASLLRV